MHVLGLMKPGKWYAAVDIAEATEWSHKQATVCLGRLAEAKLVDVKFQPWERRTYLYKRSVRGSRLLKSQG